MKRNRCVTKEMREIRTESGMRLSAPVFIAKYGGKITEWSNRKDAQSWVNEQKGIGIPRYTRSAKKWLKVIENWPRNEIPEEKHELLSDLCSQLRALSIK